MKHRQSAVAKAKRAKNDIIARNLGRCRDPARERSRDDALRSKCTSVPRPMIHIHSQHDFGFERKSILLLFYQDVLGYSTALFYSPALSSIYVLLNYSEGTVHVGLRFISTVSSTINIIKLR